jgi:glycosyltransferase involved in cell wall biosynthesis
MNIVHLMASPFVGGPERQALGLAGALPPWRRTAFLSFAERGPAQPFLDRARAEGHEAVRLGRNAPRLWAVAREVAGWLRRLRADVLCCSGYKPDVVGWMAARRAGVPAVAVAHGWTGATWKVRLNEALDRLVMRRMDAVVCVSEAQAEKVRRAGVPAGRVAVIRNAVHAGSFDNPDPSYRKKLLGPFPAGTACVVAAVGRLSPEKGFEHFIDAAKILAPALPGVGFVVFGDGPLREKLARQAADRGLGGRFVLAGFRPDVEKYLPWCDAAVSSSLTEGLPVAVLEYMAAGLPVVATAVGGTPEVVEDGVTGRLVTPGSASALAGPLTVLLASADLRRAVGAAGRRRVRERFTFAAQAAQYLPLFERLAGRAAVSAAPPAAVACTAGAPR